MLRRRVFEYWREVSAFIVRFCPKLQIRRVGFLRIYWCVSIVWSNRVLANVLILSFSTAFGCRARTSSDDIITRFSFWFLFLKYFWRSNNSLTSQSAKMPMWDCHRLHLSRLFVLLLQYVQIYVQRRLNIGAPELIFKEVQTRSSTWIRVLCYCFVINHLRYKTTLSLHRCM